MYVYIPTDAASRPPARGHAKEPSVRSQVFLCTYLPGPVCIHVAQAIARVCFSRAGPKRVALTFAKTYSSRSHRPATLHCSGLMSTAAWSRRRRSGPVIGCERTPFPPRSSFVACASQLSSTHPVLVEVRSRADSEVVPKGTCSPSGTVPTVNLISSCCVRPSRYLSRPPVQCLLPRGSYTRSQHGQTWPVSPPLTSVPNPQCGVTPRYLFFARLRTHTDTLTHTHSAAERVLRQSISPLPGLQ